MTKTNTMADFKKVMETNESFNVRTNQNLNYLIRVLTASESVYDSKSPGPRLTLA